MTRTPAIGGLADRLRSATHALHSRAERAGVMRDLLAGSISRADYCALLDNLHAIYRALETVLTAHAGHSALARLVDRALFRSAAIASDLVVLRASSSHARPPLKPATLAYVERLRAIGGGRVTDAIGHAYVRYLGDLNGGQLLAPRIRMALALDSDEGTRFYHFDGIEPRERARQFRAALNAAEVPAPAADAIVQEAVWAFEQHIALFEQLAAG